MPEVTVADEASRPHGRIAPILPRDVTPSTSIPAGTFPVLLLGLGLWLIAGIDLVALARADGDAPTDPVVVAIGASYLAFGATFVAAFGERIRRSRAASLAVLVVQSLFALIYVDLSLAVLMLAPLLLPRRGAMVFGSILVAVSALVVADGLVDTPAALSPHRVAVSTGFAIGLEVVRIAVVQGFALAFGRIVAVERDAREELERIHRALALAQRELAGRERAEERARIGRELHDGLGHHLAALGLSLELARHRRDDASPVDDARALVARMLGDVRAIVRQESDSTLGIGDAIAAIVAAFPSLAFDVHIDPACESAPRELVHAVVRIAQEATTNAVRHGGATRIGIALERRDDAAVLTIADEGAGSDPLVPGSGIAGMRERVERLSGTLAITSAPDRGTTVIATFPDP